MTEVRRNIPSFSTVTSSFKSYLISLPLLTTTITCISILFFVSDCLLKDVYKTLALNPNSFIEGQVWRLITYPYPHNSLGNILVNLLVFLPLSTAIEHTIGTLEYVYVLITIFTILPGSLYLLVSQIFNGYQNVDIGGLNIWIFGVVVWESRELAGRERDILGLFRIPAHFYPVVLLLLMEILFHSIPTFESNLCGLFAGYFYSFGYLSRIIPSSGYFSNMESKTFSRLSNLRGFVKAEEGSRGGWWLPLWNQDVDGLEDSLESPLHSNIDDGAIGGGVDDHNGHDNNVRDNDHVSGEGGNNTLLNSTSAPTQNVRSVSPEISTPVFVVPSSNESSRANSPRPSDTANKNSEDLLPKTTTQNNNNIDSLNQDTTSKDVKLVSDD